MASRIVKKRLIDAAKALELAVEEMGPSPISPVFNPKVPCKLTERQLVPIILSPQFEQNPRCEVPVNPKLLKIIGTTPAFGQLPPCRPIPLPWVQELQTTLLETAAWLRYLATAPVEPVGPAPRKRPRARPRLKRARRRVRK